MLHRNILLACAKFQYVTHRQLHLLRLGHPVSIRRATKFLSSHPPKPPLLTCHTFSISPRFGRRENIYTISKNGLNVLSELSPEELFPARPPTSMFELDYQHRTAQISFWMLLEIALCSSPYRLAQIDHYFEKTGANYRKTNGELLRSKTRLDFADGTFFIPDSIILLKDRKSGLPALFSLEVVNGQDVKRTLRQIHRHMKAISERTLANQHDIPKGQDYVALFVFLRPAHLSKLLERVQGTSEFMIFKNHFLFATVDDAKRDLPGCWQKVDDDRYLHNFITGKKSYRRT